MSGIVANLEEARLIERRPHAEHTRVLCAYLTEEGRELLARAHEAVMVVEERVFAGLEEDERQRLIEALRGFTEAS